MTCLVNIHQQGAVLTWRKIVSPKWLLQKILFSLFTRIVNQNESYVCTTACQRFIASNYHSVKCFYVFLVICSLKEICLQAIRICLIKCVIMRPYIFDNRRLTNNKNSNKTVFIKLNQKRKIPIDYKLNKQTLPFYE